MVEKYYIWNMKEVIRKIAVSFVMAAVLFAMIRLSHDLTRGDDYWGLHSRGFIAVEFLSAWIFSFVALIVGRRWMALVERRRLGAAVEYLGVVMFCLACVVVTMYVSHSGVEEIGINLSQTVIPATITVLITLLYYSYFKGRLRELNMGEQRLALERARSQQLDTELRLLRSQYHPHFLFNMLNTIYMQIDEGNEAPRHTIECLSEVLRYQLYSPEKPVDAATEIEVLGQYIELCRLRASRSLKLDVRLRHDFGGMKMYPLLLVPLVENAFKYLGGKYEINIDFGMNDGMFELRVSNSQTGLCHKPVNESSGLGIDNLRRRLELLYPGCHELLLSKTDECFTALLRFKAIRD